MTGSTGAHAVSSHELAALKLLALDGARTGTVKVSCADLADRLDASSQTASRRLQALEDGGLVEREMAADGQWVAITGDGERELKREYEDYRHIFDDADGVVLDGHVTSGMGEGRHYISLPGYARQFEERLGYEPYPGTLNVDLTERAVRDRSALDALDAIPIDGWEGEDRTYGPAACYPAIVENGAGDAYGDAHAIVPERTHHDETQLELIAPDELRAELGLEDDDEVSIRVEER
jgi:riboflavin kinase